MVPGRFQAVCPDKLARTSRTPIPDMITDSSSDICHPSSRSDRAPCVCACESCRRLPIFRPWRRPVHNQNPALQDMHVIDDWRVVAVRFDQQTAVVSGEFHLPSVLISHGGGDQQRSRMSRQLSAAVFDGKSCVCPDAERAVVTYTLKLAARLGLAPRQAA